VLKYLTWSFMVPFFNVSFHKFILHIYLVVKLQLIIPLFEANYQIKFIFKK